MCSESSILVSVRSFSTSFSTSSLVLLKDTLDYKVVETIMNYTYNYHETIVGMASCFIYNTLGR